MSAAGAPRLPDAPPGTPSPWVTRWAHLLRPHARVLDLACGNGRHAAWLAQGGHAVLAVDRDPAALAAVAALPAAPGAIAVRLADLEQGAWPLADEAPFDAVVVTNYLHRPLWPHLLDALAPGGVLLYETFAAGNETVGKPSNPAFLLAPGELLQAVRGTLRVVGFEDGILQVPRTAFVQRLCAVREGGGNTEAHAPARYPLPG